MVCTNQFAGVKHNYVKSVFLESHNIHNRFGGFGQFNYHLIRGLYQVRPNDFQITLHASDTGALQSEFGSFFNYRKYRSISRYPAFRIRQKYDLWHCLNQNIKVEPYHNLPYLLTVHDINFVDEVSAPEQRKRGLRFTEKLKRSSAIVYISNYVKEHTSRHFDIPEVPQYVIYNGNPIVDTLLPDDFRPRIQTARPFLFSIGEFSARKNFHTLVEMLAKLPGFDLILAGNNETDYAKNKLADTIRRLKLENRVLITGKVDELEKRYYLKNCFAFVFPSLLEGFGFPPIEAMRFGKPVFLHDATSLPEVGGDHAYYWTHFDPEYMARVFEQGIHDFEMNRKSCEQNCIAWASKFDWKETAKSYAQIYNSLT